MLVQWVESSVSSSAKVLYAFLVIKGLVFLASNFFYTFNLKVGNKSWITIVLEFDRLGSLHVIKVCLEYLSWGPSGLLIEMHGSLSTRLYLPENRYY